MYAFFSFLLLTSVLCRLSTTQNYCCCVPMATPGLHCNRQLLHYSKPSSNQVLHDLIDRDGVVVAIAVAVCVFMRAILIHLSSDYI